MLKKSKTYIAILLALVVAFTTILPAMASEPVGSGPLTSNDPANPVEATIAKKLEMPVGTVTPTATFTFEATAMEHNSGDGLGPALGSWDVNFTPANVAGNAENGIVSVVLETVNIFDGVIFPAAGIYKYEITERDRTNLEIENHQYQWLEYSTAKYTIFVYVENTGVGNETFVAGLGTFVTEVDNDNHVEGEKVDPTPGGGDNYAYSQMVFTNTFVRGNPPTDPLVNPTLAVDKQVSGNLANKQQLFDFSITVEMSALLAETMKLDYFRAYIVDLDRNVVLTGEELADSGVAGLINTGVNPNYIRIAVGESVDFKLKHNQRLAFVDTPVGATYTVEEKGVANYTSSVIVLSNNVETLDKEADDVGLALNTGEQLIGVNRNSAAFTNTREDVAPAGLLLNNLPFILLIALGLGVFGLYVAVKMRRREYEV